MKLQRLLMPFTIGTALLITSCGEPTPAQAPVVNTPAGAKVDLSQVSMLVTNVQLSSVEADKFTLSFDYTVDNQSGSDIVFPCLHNRLDYLIEVNLSDKDDNRLQLGQRFLEGLTLTEPRPLRIAIGQTTRSYKVPMISEARKKGDPISLRVRLHVPSRYDELRSSLEAPRLQIPWPDVPQES